MTRPANPQASVFHASSGHGVVAAPPFVARQAGLKRWFGDLVVMTKPRITVMVAFTTYVGYSLGSRHTSGWTAWLPMIVTLVGTALSCMSASVLNQVVERHTDALMERTRNRPIPMGRVSCLEGMVWGVMLGLVGVGCMAVSVGVNPAVFAGFTIASYVLVYTPLKTITSLSTIVGAVPGAMPPLIGYVAAAGQLGLDAWLLFAILFLWQLPHFLAIAWLYRVDYKNAGIVVLPVLDSSGKSTFRQMLLGCLALLPLGMLPTMLGIAGPMYFFGALLAGLAFLGSGVVLVLGKNERLTRATFTASLVYLPVVYTLILLDSR
jgi:protoheme IX farnesyltransferase